MTTALDNLTESECNAQWKVAHAMWVEMGKDPVNVDESWLFGWLCCVAWYRPEQ